MWIIPDSHYIAKLKTKSNDSPSDELYTNDIKKFKCTFNINNQETTDNECEIFKSENSNGNKLKNLENFSKETKIQKTDIETENVNVVIKSKIIDNLDWATVGDITVKEKDNSNKTYGTFSLLYKINSGNSDGKTPLWISTINKYEKISADSGTTSEDVDKWYCRLQIPETKILPVECKIFKPKASSTKINDAKDLKLSDFEELKKIDDFKNDLFYILDLKENKKNINDSIKNISIFREKISGTQKIHYLVGTINLFIPLSDEDNFNVSTSSPIILN